jgi:hypothetical protein
MVVTSELITTPAVTSRKMEVNQEQVETQAVKHCFTEVVDVPAARSSYAKDGEHTSPGRSPDSWLQALFILPSHSISNSGWLSSSQEDELLTSYSSA